MTADDWMTVAMFVPTNLLIIMHVKHTLRDQTQLN